MKMCKWHCRELTIKNVFYLGNDLLKMMTVRDWDVTKAV